MTVSPRLHPVEWDANVYHRVSAPQVTWGQKVLSRLPLSGTETVLDAGCGTGRLTAELLERLPQGRVIALDQSANMLAEAAGHLEPRFGDRVRFVQADVQDLSLPDPVDAIFSTATFHWVPDHPRLFQRLYASLKPGGWLVAQCGGGTNIAQLRQRAADLLDSPTYRLYAAGWRDPWHFASAEETATRLAAAGFVEIAISLEHEPTPFADAASYREFVTSVVLRAHLDALDGETARTEFMTDITVQAANDDPPFILDYWRLNLTARRPPAS